MVIALSMTAGAQTQVKEHRRSITLDEAIVIARTQSVDAAVALNELKTAYWEYRTFRANLLPEMQHCPAIIRNIIHTSRKMVLIRMSVTIICR